MNMLFCGVVESYQDGNASSAGRSYEHQKGIAYKERGQRRREGPVLPEKLTRLDKI